MSVANSRICSHVTIPSNGKYASFSLPGGLFRSSKEVEADNGFEHALVLFYPCPVPAAFLAEHSPCLEVRDSMFDGGADCAEGSVERSLSGSVSSTGEWFDRDDPDARDPNIAQVR